MLRRRLPYFQGENTEEETMEPVLRGPEGGRPGLSPLTRDQLLAMLRALLLLRGLEERTVELSTQGQVPGFLHSYLGQEAPAVGVCAQLRRDDWVAGTHRSRGVFLAKGLEPHRLIAEVLGKAAGPCRGRGGEMHLAEPSLGILGSSGIVGGILSVALGAAFSAQYRGTDQVVACFFGDGAVNQGTFHETVNLASLWKLPVLFVCENNRWGEFTPQARSSAVCEVAGRAEAYALPSVCLDGDDVLAVYHEAGEAVARARKGEGPTLLECLTHRWTGHFVGDAQSYRPPQELEEAKSCDAVARFRQTLLAEGLLTPEGAQSLEREVLQEVEAAVKFALDSPFPSPQELLLDVYGGEG